MPRSSATIATTIEWRTPTVLNTGQRRKLWIRSFSRVCVEIDREQLEYRDQLSYDLFKIKRELSLEGNQFPSHLQPINQFYSVTNSFVQLGSGNGAHPFKTVKDYEDFLSRADDFSVIIDQIITNMKLGMQQGVTQPRILMQKLVPQIDAHSC